MQTAQLFNHQDKKEIALKIEKIRNKKYFKQIFKIIHEDEIKYTINDNGVYVNINALSDTTLIKVKEFLETVDVTKNIIPVPKEYVPYCSDDYQSSDIKLSVQEKNLLKKLKNDTKTSWINNNDSDMINSITTEEVKKTKIELKPLNLLMSD